MPFKSEAQRRFMHATNPKIAKRWEKHTPKGRKLPEKVNESIDNEIFRISELLEDVASSGGTSHMTGASNAQITMMVPPTLGTVVSEPSGYGDSDQEEPRFTELELKITSRFMELVGGPERARELINKCDECQECLGIGDDVSDDSSIKGIAAVMPYESDLPATRGMDISALYNPNTNIGPFMQ